MKEVGCCGGTSTRRTQGRLDKWYLGRLTELNVSFKIIIQALSYLMRLVR